MWRERSDELLQQGRGWKNWLSANQSGIERERKGKREGGNRAEVQTEKYGKGARF